MNAVFFGQNNKKRKRDEVDGLDMDDPRRRKQRLIQERLEQLNANGIGAEDYYNAAAEVLDQDEQL
jgi:hypothetical protein